MYAMLSQINVSGYTEEEVCAFCRWAHLLFVKGELTYTEYAELIKRL